jgi:hypothetical protein
LKKKLRELEAMKGSDVSMDFLIREWMKDETIDEGHGMPV